MECQWVQIDNECSQAQYGHRKRGLYSFKVNKPLSLHKKQYCERHKDLRTSLINHRWFNM